MVEVVGTRTVRLLTTPQPSEYSFDCVAGETLTQEALFEGQFAKCTPSSAVPPATLTVNMADGHRALRDYQQHCS